MKWRVRHPRRRPRVAIVQPWVAEYHRAFLDRLHQELGTRGIDFLVVEDATIRGADIRGDVANTTAHKELPSYKVQLAAGRIHATRRLVLRVYP